MGIVKNSFKRKLLNPFKGDGWIWGCFGALAAISLISVYSSIGYSAIAEMGTTPDKAFGRHVLFVFASLIGIILLSNMDYRKFSKASWFGYVISIVLLVLVLVLGGDNAAGSGKSRWLYIPLIGRFQPSELAKVVIIVYLARLLAQEKDNLKEWATFRNIVLAVIFLLAFIIPDNLSTVIIIFLVCFTMMRIAPVDGRYWRRTFFGIIALALLAIFVGNQMKIPFLARSETWTNRIDNWLHFNPDELTQESMARMAVASGKFMGVGIGSTVQARLMTQANNDLIYAIIIEESGMAGGIIVFLIYAFLYFRCIRIACRCKGPFGRMTVAGLGTLIFLQAAIHMGVSVGALPVTGQTLPFISSGGSAYLCMGLALGIIQAVAQDVKENELLEGKNASSQPFNHHKNLSNNESNN